MSTGHQDIPQPLADLRTPYEKHQVSLLTILSTTLKKQNPFTRTWEHKLGQVNLLSKSKTAYSGMYGFFVDNNPTGKHADSKKRIAEALGWLHKSTNPLYKEFLANAETLFQSTTSTLPHDDTLTDARGNKLSSHLEKEEQGLAMAYEPESNTPQLTSSSDHVGVQHQATTNVKWDKMPNPTYYDKDLEAKAWPHIFPYGTGSWHYDSPLKPHQIQAAVCRCSMEVR